MTDDTDSDTGSDTDWPGDDVQPMWAYDGENIVWDPFHGFAGDWRITDEDAAAGTVSQPDVTAATIAWDDGRIEHRAVVDGTIVVTLELADTPADS